MYHEAKLQFSGVLKIITGLASLADYQHGTVHNPYIATENLYIWSLLNKLGELSWFCNESSDTVRRLITLPISTDIAWDCLTCMRMVSVRQLWGEARCVFWKSSELGHRICRRGIIQVIRHLSECDPMLDRTSGTCHWLWSFAAGGGGWGDAVLRSAGSIFTWTSDWRQFKQLWWSHGGLVEAWEYPSLQLKRVAEIGSRETGRGRSR